MKYKGILENCIRIPKALIYVRIREETYEAYVTNDYDIVISNANKEARNQELQLFLYSIRLHMYEKIVLKVSKRKAIEQNMILFINRSVKCKIEAFVEEVKFPELNLAEESENKRKLEVNNLVKYCIQKDRKFERRITDCVDEFSNNTLNYFSANMDILASIECGVTLDTTEKLLGFINDDFKNCIKPADKFSEFWYRRFVSRVYIGSQLCSLKASDIRVIKAAILTCVKRNLDVTLNTSIITEQGILFLQQLFNMLKNLKLEENFWGNFEIVVNDYAVIYLLDKFEMPLKYNLGILLNRRQKDPRYNYRWNYSNAKEHFRNNELNIMHDDVIVDFYNQFKFFEYENNPIGNIYKSKRNVLHFPFYQTNTSRYCPMNAAIVNGDSNRQYNVKSCEHFCEQYFYQYSDNLSLIGVGNSNLGVYDNYGEMIREIRNGNICRLVWDML